jgi:hypothetical protein
VSNNSGNLEDQFVNTATKIVVWGAIIAVAGAFIALALWVKLLFTRPRTWLAVTGVPLAALAVGWAVHSYSRPHESASAVAEGPSETTTSVYSPDTRYRATVTWLGRSGDGFVKLRVESRGLRDLAAPSSACVATDDAFTNGVSPVAVDLNSSAPDGSAYDAWLYFDVPRSSAARLFFRYGGCHGRYSAIPLGDPG